MAWGTSAQQIVLQFALRQQDNRVGSRRQRHGALARYQLEFQEALATQ
jgi:hypothetical protein